MDVELYGYEYVGLYGYSNGDTNIYPNLNQYRDLHLHFSGDTHKNQYVDGYLDLYSNDPIGAGGLAAVSQPRQQFAHFHPDSSAGAIGRDDGCFHSGFPQGCQSNNSNGWFSNASMEFRGCLGRSGGERTLLYSYPRYRYSIHRENFEGAGFKVRPVGLCFVVPTIRL